MKRKTRMMDFTPGELLYVVRQTPSGGIVIDEWLFSRVLPGARVECKACGESDAIFALESVYKSKADAELAGGM